MENSNQENFLKFDKILLERLISETKNGNENSKNSLALLVRKIAYTYFISKFKGGKIKFEEDVEDLSQNVVLTFLEQIETIQQPEFWLRRVIFLNFVNYYKSSKKRFTYSLNDKLAKSKTADSSNDEKIDAEKAAVQLSKLSDEKKAIIKMRIWADEKFSDIAEKLGKNEPAVKKMFYRALEELKKYL